MTAWFSGLWRRAAPVVEAASPRDAARLAAIHAASFHRGWGDGEFDAMLRERNTLVQRLRLGSKIIGFAVSRLGADEAEILSIGVAPNWQRAGVAAGLLQGLSRAARRGDAKRIFLDVAEDNEAALALYRKLGFEKVGERPAYYADKNGVKSTALVMKRDLR